MVHASCVYALTIGLVLAFCLAGLYALSATGDIRRLPLTRMAIITIVVLNPIRHKSMLFITEIWNNPLVSVLLQRQNH